MTKQYLSIYKINKNNRHMFINFFKKENKKRFFEIIILRKLNISIKDIYYIIL